MCGNGTVETVLCDVTFDWEHKEQVMLEATAKT